MLQKKRLNLSFDFLFKLGLIPCREYLIKIRSYDKYVLNLQRAVSQLDKGYTYFNPLSSPSFGAKRVLILPPIYEDFYIYVAHLELYFKDSPLILSFLKEKLASTIKNSTRFKQNIEEIYDGYYKVCQSYTDDIVLSQEEKKKKYLGSNIAFCVNSLYDVGYVNYQNIKKSLFFKMSCQDNLQLYELCSQMCRRKNT